MGRTFPAAGGQLAGLPRAWEPLERQGRPQESHVAMSKSGVRQPIREECVVGEVMIVCRLPACIGHAVTDEESSSGRRRNVRRETSSCMLPLHSAHPALPCMYSNMTACGQILVADIRKADCRNVAHMASIVPSSWLAGTAWPVAVARPRSQRPGKAKTWGRNARRLRQNGRRRDSTAE
jgi:hypothetical protein